MTLDPRDAALHASCPCVSMPMFGALEEMQSGQRMVVGRNGLFMQIRTPWLDCTTRVAGIAGELRLPYGTVPERLALAFGVIPLDLLHQFIEQARQVMPTEAAGALVYDTHQGTLRLQMHEAIDASGAHIRYRVAELADWEVLAVDLHSHGRLGAFWSAQDDRDDQGVRVCGVFGNLDREQPTAKFRLAINGLFLPLPSPWDGAPAASA